jgi:hypothetical protein
VNYSKIINKKNRRMSKLSTPSLDAEKTFDSYESKKIKEILSDETNIS